MLATQAAVEAAKLIADEPFSHLDPQWAAAVADLIEEAA